MYPDAVLFDLDDTLCQHERTTADRLADAFAAAGVDPFFTVDDFRRWAPRVEGEDPLDFREQCFAAIAEEQDRDVDPAYRVAAAYEDPDPTDVRFRPGAEAALEELADDYRLGLVTNGGEAHQREKLDALGIADYFEAASYATPETGIKPDPAPFHEVLADLDVAADRAVHVGNSLTTDVAGAQAAGVATVWVPAYEPTGKQSHAPDYTVDSLHDLVPPPWA
ncbi:HAD family hydrolase [Halobacteriaceae archaeon GCM10025711]